MKLIGFLLVTFGFIAAALASVIDEDTIKWSWYIPSLVVGIIGAVVIKIDNARHNKTEHHVASRIETVYNSLERLVANINQLNNDKNSINTYDIRFRIDELFIEDLERYVDARESIAHRFGLAAYGEVMSNFAAGERYLNRVWSASADGYIDEVNTYLEKAREQFVESLNKINKLKIENPQHKM